MGNTFYNLDKLIKISVHQPKDCWFYKIKKEIKILGFLYQKSGVYEFGVGYVSPIEEFEMTHNDYVIFDGNVYEKPRCVLYFQDNFSYVSHFNEYKDAFNMGRGIQDKLPNLVEISKFI